MVSQTTFPLVLRNAINYVENDTTKLKKYELEILVKSRLTRKNYDTFLSSIPIIFGPPSPFPSFDIPSLEGISKEEGKNGEVTTISTIRSYRVNDGKYRIDAYTNQVVHKIHLLETQRYSSPFPYLLRLSDEVSMKQDDYQPQGRNEEIRERYRKTFFYPFFQIDLTIVNGNKYELEVEFNLRNIIKQAGVDNALETLSNLYKDVLKKLERLIAMVPTIASFPDLSKARNLRLPDLVYGGVVGNPNTRYGVSTKADGYRHYLKIEASKITLFDDLNKKEVYSVTSQIASSIDEAIWEVEMIPSANRKSGAPTVPYWLLAYDNLTLAEKPYVERYASLSSFTVGGMVVDVKPLYELGVSNFFLTTSTLLTSSYPYATDGIIFTPLDLSYAASESKDKPLNERILTERPDICKWKPDITIDLKIRNGKLYGERDTPFEMILAEVAKRILGEVPWISPYYSPSLLPSGPSLIGPGTDPIKEEIAEFGFDWPSKLFTFRRIRNDKDYPNSNEVISDNIIQIVMGIKPTTIMGRDTVLMKRYHNRIKEMIFSSINRNETLLDIGSGDGQDTTKWRKSGFPKIYAIEPNGDHLEKLRKRIEDTGLTNRVVVIPVMGQETEKILSYFDPRLPRPGVVAMMLSLTFFWENRQVLRGLVNTILSVAKEDAPLYFFTLDGDSIDAFFAREKGTEPGPLTNDHLLKGKTFSLTKSGESITVDIEGSHVRNQKEWEVHLNDLVSLLNEGKRCCYEVKQYFHADREYLLPEDQFKLSSLYTFGVIAKKNYYPLKNMSSLPVPKPLPAKLLPLQRVDLSTLYPTATISISATPVPSTPIPTIPIPTTPVPNIPVPNIPVPNIPVSTIPVPSTPVPTIPVPSTPVPYPLSILSPEGIAELPRVDGLEPLYRVGTIADGNCFMHAFLRAFDQNYVNSGIPARIQYAETIRAGLSQLLAVRDISTITRIIGSNPFVLKSGEMVYDVTTLKALEGLPRQETGLPFDMNLVNLQNFLRTRDCLGNEIFLYISQVYSINLLMLEANSVSTRLVEIIDVDPKRPYIAMVLVSKNHYELVRSKNATVFYNNDPLIQYFLRSLKRD